MIRGVGIRASGPLLTEYRGNSPRTSGSRRLVAFSFYTCNPKDSILMLALRFRSVLRVLVQILGVLWFEYAPWRTQ